MRRVLIGTAPFVAYAALTILIFWAPLARHIGSIQWDSVGVHFFNIAFSSTLLHQGILPLWTSHIFGGFPQIADMQVALWYPPMFAIAALTKFTATKLLAEIALHYFLAASFMFLLARKLKAPPVAAWGLGLAYALGGFMIGHASHVGMMNVATWLPLIFVLLLHTLEHRSYKVAVACGVALGISMLAGHFQVSLYIILLVILYGGWVTVESLIKNNTRQALGTIGLVALVGVFAIGISAIQYLPTLQLVGQSERSAIPLSVAQSESLKSEALVGYVDWNHLGVATGPYTGPWDRTQNYLFIGLSTLALAMFASIRGLWKPETRLLTGFFVFTTLFSIAYALGPVTPLHGLLYHIPLLGTVRAPGNMMLLAHLSLICLAALSWQYIPKRFLKWSAIAFAIIITLELVPKALRNELLWARQNPDAIFSNAPIAQQVLKEYATLPLEQRFRVWRVPGLDANEPQFWGIDDFGGYNPLQLARHARYTETMTQFPRLMALAAIRYGPCEFIGGTQLPAPWAPKTCRTARTLPRVFLVNHIQTTHNPDEALRLLTKIEPSSVAIVERDASGRVPEMATNNGPLISSVRISAQAPGYLRLAVSSSTEALVLITETFWPGWQATVNGAPAQIWRTDYLFQGVRISAGTHTIELFYRPRIFIVGVLTTMLTLCGVLVVLVLHFRKTRQKTR